VAEPGGVAHFYWHPRPPGILRHAPRRRCPRPFAAAAPRLRRARAAARRPAGRCGGRGRRPDARRHRLHRLRLQHAVEHRPAAGGRGAGGGAGGASGDRDPLRAALGGVQPSGGAGADGGAGRVALGARHRARRAAAGGGGRALRRFARAGRGGRRGGGAAAAAARLPRRPDDARAPGQPAAPAAHRHRHRAHGAGDDPRGPDQPPLDGRRRRGAGL
ncbi:MAG: hypothetical protein AVDCRST_MAG04-2759, partial [uncultured Acetobacteraceae bacterium]